MSATEILRREILRRLDDGTLKRRSWTGLTDDGRETACLLVAIAPDCGPARRASACPADVLSPWMAHLVPWLDDEGSSEAWRGMVRRFAAIAGRWHALTPQADQELEYEVRALCVLEAMLHGDDSAFLDASKASASAASAAASAAWAATRAAAMAASDRLSAQILGACERRLGL